MSHGYSIELNNKFDWSEDSVLSISPHNCSVILINETDEKNKYFIILEFKNALIAKSITSDCNPVIGINETPGKSSIYVLTESNWDEEAHCLFRYSGSPKRIERKHFVIACHDVFHEILAVDFKEIKIDKNHPNYSLVESTYNLLSRDVI